jgi:hypothetical protein
MSAAFQRVVLARLWLTFVVLGLSFFAFGAGTVNLGLLLMANSRLLAEYGWQAVMDGSLRQLVELVLTGYLSIAAYVVDLPDPVAPTTRTRPRRLSAMVFNTGGRPSSSRLGILDLICRMTTPTAPR